MDYFVSSHKLAQGELLRALIVRRLNDETIVTMVTPKEFAKKTRFLEYIV